MLYARGFQNDLDIIIYAAHLPIVLNVIL